MFRLGGSQLWPDSPTAGRWRARVPRSLSRGSAPGGGMASDPAVVAAQGGAGHATQTITRSRRRRRPSGEPPPLPRPLNTSGRFWLGLAAAVLALWITVAVTSSSAVDVADHRVLLWLAT